MSTPQSETELMAHLKEQIDFLQRSAKAYDEGYTSEAKRIATTIRVLLHDTNRSKSLLTLLGKKEIKFYNTSMDYDGGLASTMKLLIITIRGKGLAERGRRGG